jgi:hypothetical protein
MFNMCETVVGGSNFRLTTDTASLKKSECTSIPIKEDKSAYWFPVSFSKICNESSCFSHFLASLLPVRNLLTIS